MPEHRFVERRDQGRALAAGGHVAAPEVRDDVDAGALREARGIVQLDREAEVGAMAHRLAVAADRADRALRATPASREDRSTARA